MGKTTEILNLNSLKKEHHDYIMSILQKAGKPLEMGEALNIVFDDTSRPAEFRKQVITAVLGCPSSVQVN